MGEFDVSWQAGPGVSMFARDLFEGKVAVITGGGSGLGREVALGFARLGGHPVIAGRTAEKLEDVVRSVKELGGECTAIPTNIRDTQQVDALRDEVYERFGRADFLVNNAGGQFPALPSAISDNGWRAVVDLNLNGTWNVTNRFMKPMAEAGFGAIVNVVTLFSFDRGAPMFLHSGAARAGVVNMAKTLAPYLMRHGVTINVLAPGIFLTDALIESELGPLGHTEETFVDELVTQRMSARMGTVDEMAGTILYLCSPAARYVCGATLIADGASMQGNWVSSLLPGPDEF
ncbi:MAG TPA: SDR family NAD(P)-dependent oxidoreductase [Acidimicrobiales bacterium]|jgi:NAD(P)-dependent dehydrogenase (short-subunit alcohol dehydrogenase family)|nr:SDR family NAD(P)-dependent oxidoreductase [Acidimicrobiales bacterium]